MASYHAYNNTTVPPSESRLTPKSAFLGHHKISVWQLGIVVGISAFIGLFWPACGPAMILGGLIQILGTWGFVWVAFKNDVSACSESASEFASESAKSSAKTNAKYYLKAFYRAEMAKWALILLAWLLVLGIFRYHHVGLLLGFILSQLVYWVLIIC